MKCPSCGSEKIRRSARRGIKEGLFLRLRKRAPFRCISCGRRFIERADAQKFRRQGRFPGLAAYLGLRRGQRSKLRLLLVSLGLLFVLLLIIIAFTWYLSNMQPDRLGKPSRTSLKPVQSVQSDAFNS
jgi:predicted RNA-binding Zn-ribbon protein involved in translation (DUF1610 family)